MLAQLLLLSIHERYGHDDAAERKGKNRGGTLGHDRGHL